MNKKQQLEEDIKQLEEEKANIVKSKKKDIQNRAHSEHMRVVRETENMIDVHKDLKTRFFAPTQEQIDRFSHDIPIFLKSFAMTGSIKESCKATKSLDPCAVYYLQTNEPIFKEDFEIAKKIFATDLNDVATDRAVHGTLTPTTYQGEHVTDIKVPDNRLLETVLRANLPHLYDRKSLDRIPGQDKPQLNINIVNFAPPNSAKTSMGNVRKVTDDGHISKNTDTIIEVTPEKEEE